MLRTEKASSRPGRAIKVQKKRTLNTRMDTRLPITIVDATSVRKSESLGLSVAEL